MMLRVIKWEYRKLFVKNGGMLWILFFILTLIAGNSLQATSTESPYVQKLLSQYYEEYGGKLTEETVAAIEQKRNAIDEAVLLQNRAYSEFENQIISQAQLEQTLNEVMPLLREQRAFNKFYARYSYCTKDPERRFLIDPQGWSSLLQLDSPDFALLFFVILLAALIYKTDCPKSITQMLKPTCYGCVFLLYAKWVVAIGVALILGIMTQVIDILFRISSISWQNGAVPLQSLSAYSASPYNITIWQGYLYASLIRIFGLMYCSFLTICLVEICRNTVLGSFCTLAVVLLPYFAANQDSIYLKWPVPAGFVQALYYFVGGNSDSPKTLNAMLKAACLSVGIIIFLCVIAKQRYCDFKRKSRTRLVLGAFLVVVCLPGCSQINMIGSMNYSSSYSPDVIEADDYYVYRDEEMIVVEKLTAKQYSLLNDPLESESFKQTFSNAKTVGNVIYFMCINENQNKTIQSINLDTGERNTLFTDNLFREDIKLFDVTIWQRPVITNDQIVNRLVDFFVLKNQLILIRGETISALQNGKEKLLYEGYFRNVSSNGETIFFTNEEAILCSISISPYAIKQFSNIYPSKMIAIDSRIFYLNPSDENALYSFDINTEEQTLVQKGNWRSLSTDGARFVLRDLNNKWYILDLKESSLTEIIIPYSCSDIVLLKGVEKIIIVSYDDSQEITYKAYDYCR